MRFKNNMICYIPNLINNDIGRVDDYRFLDSEVGLDLLLWHTGESIAELLRQYPTALLLEEIHKLEDKEYQSLRNNMGDKDCYYHYYGKDNGCSQGICIYSLDHVEDSGIFSMNVTTNIGKDYQRRVQLFYDGIEEYFVPQSVIEVEKSKGIIVERSFSPKVLRKVKKYIQY